MPRYRTARGALAYALKYDVAQQVSKGHLRVRQAEVGEEVSWREEVS